MVRQVQHYALEIRVIKLRALKVRLAEVRTLELRVAEVCAPEVRIIEVRALEIRVTPEDRERLVRLLRAELTAAQTMSELVSGKRATWLLHRKLEVRPS